MRHKTTAWFCPFPLYLEILTKSKKELFSTYSRNKVFLFLGNMISWTENTSRKFKLIRDLTNSHPSLLDLLEQTFIELLFSNALSYCIFLCRTFYTNLSNINHSNTYYIYIYIYIYIIYIINIKIYIIQYYIIFHYIYIYIILYYIYIYIYIYI